MATLDGLATELIYHILEYLEPPALRSVALVCRRLAGIATEELRFCRKYRAISDQQPATVPSLLRDILQGNARAARRVRSIEIYGTRLAWDHWNDANVYKLTLPEGYNATPAADVPTQGYGPGFFDETELEKLHHLMVDDLSLAPDTAERWRARIAEGNDAALKVLLIALCPRLTAVRFVQNPSLRDYGHADERYVAKTSQHLVLLPADQYGSQPETEREDTRSLLASAIASIFATAEKKWPSGLLSLEDVALGVKSKSTSELGDMIVHSSAQIGTEVASRFFCLPNLKTIYIHGLTRVFPLYEDNDEDERPWAPTDGCSSVQHILLDNPNNPEYGALEAMFRSSGRNLRSIIFHGGTIADSFELDAIFSCLERTYAVPGPYGNSQFIRYGNSNFIKAPETLLFCSTAVNGYRSVMYYPEYVNTSVATMPAEDIWCGFEYILSNENRPEQELWREEFRNHLPSSTVTVFNGVFDAAQEPMVDQQLARFIRQEVGDWSDEDEDEDGGDEDDEDEDAEDDNKADDEDDNKDHTGEEGKEGEDEGADKGGHEEDNSGKQGNNGDYEPPEMALYLTSLDDYPAERTYRWWSKTIAAGKRNGVKVHTRTTKPPKGSDYGFQVQWPEGVSDNILETSPWHKHPSLPKVYFKPHVGFVEDCEHCGRCDECFKCYPPEVWAAIKKERSEESDEED